MHIKCHLDDKSKDNEMGGISGTHGGEVHIWFRLKNLKKQQLGRSRHWWEGILTSILKKQEKRVWIGYIRLKTRTSGGLL